MLPRATEDSTHCSDMWLKIFGIETVLKVRGLFVKPRCAGELVCNGDSFRLIAVVRGLGMVTAPAKSSSRPSWPACLRPGSAVRPRWGQVFDDGTQVRKMGAAQPLGVGAILHSCCSRRHVRPQLGPPTYRPAN